MKSDPKYINLILTRLSKRYGYDPHTHLKHRNMVHLFVATFLSPQSTDVQVNKATPRLFNKFKAFEDYASADPRTLQRYLKSINFYKTKARNLKRSASMIVERFDGEVPKTIAELTELPGVGRKVANVILNEGYGIDEGIAVDTHCGRVSVRLGLSRHKGNPAKIERDLLQRIPKKEWGRASNLLIELGRDACKARNRECFRCVLKDVCPSSNAKNGVNVSQAKWASKQI
ncbi:MAG: endonuclease III domain-containing protein [Candidatus Micrarchaeaceae archaeon]